MECPVCFENISQKPYISLCGNHVVCLDCQAQFTKKWQCPVCRVEISSSIVYEIKQINQNSKTQFEFIERATNNQNNICELSSPIIFRVFKGQKMPSRDKCDQIVRNCIGEMSAIINNKQLSFIKKIERRNFGVSHNGLNFYIDICNKKQINDIMSIFSAQYYLEI